MPRIFDNIDQQLMPALCEALTVARRADFCVGYFNLRGWRQIDNHFDEWAGGEGNCCRVLVGMPTSAPEELQSALSLEGLTGGLDNQAALRQKRKLAEDFRDQLARGIPTAADEAGLRRLARQLRARQVVVKLYLRSALHAKLYLAHRDDRLNPTIAFLGSSNLTFAGLVGQGELNVDVMDGDATGKLSAWFEDRWNDRWGLDISDELAAVIEESWARESLIPPYHIYLKMPYHLSSEARAGLAEYQIPREFEDQLFDFQKAAVQIAARHLTSRGGVLIGDVVGLGKTIMATALARIFEDMFFLETLIICPKNLVRMWEDYRTRYRLRARVLPLSRVITELADMPRFRIVVIDESHNLRNREGRRYRAIQAYIEKNESRCILLSATPYNKTYLDLSSQLRLFVPEDRDVGVRPERLIKEIGEREFNARYQAPVRSLAAFEKSGYPDDWRELMRLFLVRRTRSFILENYTDLDTATGRRYLHFADGRRAYFPTRVPRTLRFPIDEADPTDQYARLYSDDVVAAINTLNLPRYGLGNYLTAAAASAAGATADEQRTVQNLGRAGKRLMGFARTNLFKRLESSGEVFLRSVERHVLRNYIFLHAIDHGLPVPIGTQDLGLLDSRLHDDDEDLGDVVDAFDHEGELGESAEMEVRVLRTSAAFRQRAAEVYDEYRARYAGRFQWLRPALFTPALAADLRADADALAAVLSVNRRWDADGDTKLAALIDLLTRRHGREKVLVFTQFADTVRYLEAELAARGVTDVAGVTGDAADPTLLAWRFSPVSNDKRSAVSALQETPSRFDEGYQSEDREVAPWGPLSPAGEIRVLIATDVLSEGQNLQDCAIVVNYDLPWAIIRLIQRAGRVDRIGQQATDILCYTFLPADGVERILRLRARVTTRLRENAEVVGTDESFFEDGAEAQAVWDLYNERSGVLDGDGDVDGEIDLASFAYQIWKNAVTADPKLAQAIPRLPPVVFSARPHRASDAQPEGVLVYLRTGQGNDVLAWVDAEGRSITESQFAILKAAECAPGTPALPRDDRHHELVAGAVALVTDEERAVGGQLGRPSGARYRTYERLKRIADAHAADGARDAALLRAVDDLYRFPLRSSATDTLNRRLRTGASDAELVELVLDLRERDQLCNVTDEVPSEEPRIICSLGLRTMDRGAP